VTIVDLIIVIFVVGALFHGVRVGAAVQIASFAGLWGGLAVGSALAPAASKLVSGAGPRVIVSVLTVFGTAGILSAAGRALSARLIIGTRSRTVARADAGVGAVVGGSAMLLATWLIASMIGTLPLPGLTTLVQRSAILHGLNEVLPPAPSIFSRIQRMLDPAGFPNVFAGFEPPAASPLPTPSDPAIRAAVAHAAPSTVKIVGTACGEILTGSGFVIAHDTVVTDAHVVAGENGQTVDDRFGGHPAFAVLFDPKLDIAVLHVSGLPDPPLAMTSASVPRGTDGAVLGYPGGGPLTTGPAVVLREETAVGRDIYGQSLTARDIYELNAQVRPGNSGGPLVSTGGSVIGVVFARSARDPNVGYALTSATVSSRIASRGSEPVSTGPCAAD
jgi:S1-C subfamily serine protease